MIVIIIKYFNIIIRYIIIFIINIDFDNNDIKVNIIIIKFNNAINIGKTNIIYISVCKSTTSIIF